MPVTITTVWNWQDKLSLIPREEWPNVVWLKTSQIEKLLDFNVGSALDIVDELRDNRAWESRGLKSLEQLIRDIAKIDPAAIETIRSGYHKLRANGITGTISAAQIREDQAKQAREDSKVKAGRPSHNALPSNELNQGNSSSYILRRLARNHKDILDAYERGEYASPKAAGRAAGIVHDPTPLTLLRRAWKRATAEERAAFLTEVCQ